MKKIMLFLICTILLVGTVSAIEWDNVLDYEDNDMTVKITNWLGLLGWLGIDDVIGEATLASHNTPTEIRNVMPGRNRAVMYYDFKEWEKYPNGLGEVTFTNIETSEELKKAYYFGKAIYEDVIQSEYETVCKDSVTANGTKYQQCDKVFKRYKLVKTFIRWEKLETNDIPQGDNRIALITNVGQNDYIDGVWTIAGKKVSKHAEWTESLSLNLTYYANFDQNSGSALPDLTEGFSNGTLYNMQNDSTDWVSGKLGNSLLFDGDDDFVNTNIKMSWGLTDDWSISYWYNSSNIVTGGREHFGVIAGDASAFGLDYGGSKYKYRVNTGGTLTTIESTTSIGGGVYKMHTLVRNVALDKITLYIDGEMEDNETDNSDASLNFLDQAIYFGARNGDGSICCNVHGTLDEFGIWDRALSPEEVTQLHNGGAGITWADFIPPVVNITFPLAIIYNTTQTQLNYTVDAKGVRCWFSVDNGVTNSTDNDCTANFTGLSSVHGENTWIVYSNNSDGNEAQDSVTFTVESGIDITLIEPIDNFNTTNPIINFECNATDTGGGNLVNLTLVLNGVENETNATTGTFIKLSPTLTFADGVYNWTCRAGDDEGFVVTETPNRTFEIDSTPPIINITYPINGTTYIDDYTTTLTPTLSINWTTTDTNLDTCWYYNTTANVTVTCGDNDTITIPYGTYTFTIYANDTFGHETSKDVTFTLSYKVFFINQTFNNKTIEGNTEQFTLNVSIISGLQISITNLIYNGTSNLATNVIQGNYTISTVSLTVPTITTETNVTFNWNLTLTDTSQIALPSNNQTIQNLIIDNCTAGTTLIFNYTMVDEGNQSKLDNTTLELNLDILSSDRTITVANFSELYTDVNPVEICINLNLTNGTSYSVDSIVRYEAIAYANEYYNIQDFILQESNIPQEITLYDLFGADSTEFQITFKGEDFVLVENALIFIDRQYISEDNTFKTVELPKTDSNGQTIAHFVRNDIIYNIRVVKNRVVLGNFNNIIAFCSDFTIGDCKIILEATPTAQDTFDYNEQLGIIFQSIPTYDNNTNTVSFSFSTDDGTTKTVLMEVTRSDIFGNRSICSSTVTSASGTLSCSVDPNIDDTVLETRIYVDTKLAVLGNVRLESSDYGNIGYILWFFLTFIFILLFGKSKTEILIGLCISVVGSISLGITRGDIIGLGSAGIWLLVIVILGIWKINKDNPQ